MTENDLQALLSQCAQEVLETMFFTVPMEQEGAADGFGAEPWLAAHLGFHGRHSGWFAVSLPRSTAGRLAGEFLGADADELMPEQVDDSVRELANMVCGSLLSRLDRNAIFELGSPEIADEPSDYCKQASVCSTVALDEGPVTVALRIQSPL